MKFTDQIAQYIKENELNLSHLTIVLPSERAKKYIAASLFKAYQKPLLAPKMITIDRWVRNLSEKTVIDKTRVLLRLFEIQLSGETTNQTSSYWQKKSPLVKGLNSIIYLRFFLLVF